jgi:hypothetical protein
MIELKNRTQGRTTEHTPRQREERKPKTDTKDRPSSWIPTGAPFVNPKGGCNQAFLIGLIGDVDEELCMMPMS